jgi:acyl-CoA thioesterase
MDPAATAAAMRARDRCSDALGMDLLDVGDATATVRMTVRADMCNGHGVCHGGMIFTLADTAMAFASNADVDALATAASIEFLEATREGDELRATAVERHRRGRTGIYDVSVERPDGTVVALFRGRTLAVGGATR